MRRALSLDRVVRVSKPAVGELMVGFVDPLLKLRQLQVSIRTQCFGVLLFSLFLAPFFVRCRASRVCPVMVMVEVFGYGESNRLVSQLVEL